MDPVVDIPGIKALWHSVSGGDPEVRIAIIDGPVDTTHPTLSNARLTFDHPPAVTPTAAVRSEHGTHVASILVGQPDSAVLGLVPNCTAIVLSIYTEREDGDLAPSSQATLALAINRALAAGAHLINISSGQLTPTGQPQRILVDAVHACAKAGTLIIAAAGNDGCRCLQVPAALDTVLAVGACDLDGRPLPFSNFGDAYLDNGILAPGDQVKGASPNAHVALRSGTGFATPVVTGVAALLLSRLRAAGRDASPHAVRTALLQSAIPCTAGNDDARCLAGRLDVPGAIAALLQTEADADAGVSPAQPRAPPTHVRPAQRPSLAPVFTSPAMREGTMANSMTTAASAPRILGPDGTALVASAAVTPSEPPPQPLSPQIAIAAGTGAASPVAESTAVMPAAPPQAAGTIWVPMSMPAMAPAAWGPSQPGAMMPNVPTSALRPAGVTAAMQPRSADCGCGGVRPSQATAAAPQMAFPIGRLYYDFGTEARLDYFVQAIANWRNGLAGRVTEPDEFGPGRDKSGDTAAPYNPEILVRYLMNQTPTEQRAAGRCRKQFPRRQRYHLDPHHRRCPDLFDQAIRCVRTWVYSSLVMALFLQEVSPFPPGDERTITMFTKPKGAGARYSKPPLEPVGERVTIAGQLDGSTTRLMNGTVLPTLTADWRGFYQWAITNLYLPSEDGGAPVPPPGLREFLERIYNEFRNVGVSPQDRALNYSAINAHNANRIFQSMGGTGMRLDTVEVDRSVICRPESDCWDVTYRFFDPENVLTKSRQVFQYTIDVSDLVPVAVGPLRQWQVY